MELLPRTLVLTGLALVVVGGLLYLAPSLPLLGRLPGDIRVERPGLRFYFPITTCLLISLTVTAAFWIFSKLR